MIIQAVLAAGIKEKTCRGQVEGKWNTPSSVLQSLTVLRVFFVSRPPCVSAFVAVKDVRDVGLLDLGARQVNPDAALVALNHGTSCEGLPTVTSDQVP